MKIVSLWIHRCVKQWFKWFAKLIPQKRKLVLVHTYPDYSFFWWWRIMAFCGALAQKTKLNSFVYLFLSLLLRQDEKESKGFPSGTHTRQPRRLGFSLRFGMAYRGVVVICHICCIHSPFPGLPLLAPLLSLLFIPAPPKRLLFFVISPPFVEAIGFGLKNVKGEASEWKKAFISGRSDWLAILCIYGATNFLLSLFRPAPPRIPNSALLPGHS